MTQTIAAARTRGSIALTPGAAKPACRSPSERGYTPREWRAPCVMSLAQRPLDAADENSDSVSGPVALGRGGARDDRAQDRRLVGHRFRRFSLRQIGSAS